MKVGIVGLGVMGGSILQALCQYKKTEHQIHVVTRNAESSTWAQSFEAVSVCAVASELPSNLDLLFLTTPSQALPKTCVPLPNRPRLPSHELRNHHQRHGEQQGRCGAQVGQYPRRSRIFELSPHVWF